MAKIKSIKAREILDSRGNPTVETKVTLEDGAEGIASVPSGASVGKYEAVELRDNDPQRYKGRGVLKAVANVNQTIAPKIVGMQAQDQLKIDLAMIELDGTENKANLGANAILSVSQGVAEAAATSEKVPNYEHISYLYGLKKEELKMPLPTFNLINGGKHGAGNLDFQEFHILPSSLKSYHENLRIAEEIYLQTEEVLIQYGAVHSVGDEGGFAPNLFTNVDALEVLTQAIKEAGYQFKRDVFLGLDVAANHFYKDHQYKIRDRTMAMDAKDFIQFYRDFVKQYPLALIEDPFQEDDWDSWAELTAFLTETLVVGDDLLASNKKRVQKAIDKKACNSILVKPNQIGTIAETIEVVKVARKAGWKIIVSHRSGETNDDFIADFAIGVAADYTKFGAPARGERVVKYNRLLAIEEELGGKPKS